MVYLKYLKEWLSHSIYCLISAKRTVKGDYLGYGRRGRGWRAFNTALKRRCWSLLENGRKYTHYIQFLPIAVVTVKSPWFLSTSLYCLYTSSRKVTCCSPIYHGIPCFMIYMCFSLGGISFPWWSIWKSFQLII